MESHDDVGVHMTGDEFDRYLERAEMILASADSHRARLHLYRAGLIGIAAFTGIMVAALVVVRQNPLAGGSRLLVVLASGAAASYALNKWLVAPTARLCKRDEGAMVGIVTVLRDIAPHLVKYERWDADRRQVAMERLERFPVGARKI